MGGGTCFLSEGESGFLVPRNLLRTCSSLFTHSDPYTFGRDVWSACTVLGSVPHAGGMMTSSGDLVPALLRLIC